jgi:hypothetical protein
MVIASCVAPENWPPTPENTADIASELGVEASLLDGHIDQVHKLSSEQQQRILLYVQQIANIVAHIVNERKTLVNRLEAIADLTAL